MRCAVYTRKSTEERLDLRYNSLEAQKDACRAYVDSQRHLGWRVTEADLDDGGYSGGSLERPALQRLLDLVKAGAIDVVVVHKVDRLSRSLSDFARLAELFDKHRVSFVSVTQQLDTSTAMGRLSMNVLLSFAQFEREIASERIREKIAASRLRGLWTGGVCPLGYRLERKSLIVHDEKALFVRHLFNRYLALQSVSLLRRELGQSDGGAKVPALSRGELFTILKNPVYVGKLRIGDRLVDGIHDGIVDREVWQRCQELLKLNARKKRGNRTVQSGALLLGKLCDSEGRKITRSKTFKKSKEYHYYVLASSVRGDSRSTVRIPCGTLDDAVVDAISAHLKSNSWVEAISERFAHRPEMMKSLTGLDVRKQDEVLSDLISRVVIEKNSLRIDLEFGRIISEPSGKVMRPKTGSDASGYSIRAEPAWKTIDEKSEKMWSIRPENDWTAHGRRWFAMLANGQCTSQEEIARKERVSQATVSRAIDRALSHSGPLLACPPTISSLRPLSENVGHSEASIRSQASSMPE